MGQRWCVLVLLAATVSARTGTPGWLKAAWRLQYSKEMPGLHLLRQEQRSERQRTFTAKVPSG